MDPMTKVESLEIALERLINAKPETGEAWAHICHVEKMLIEAKAELQA